MKKAVGIIPARYNSKRLPGKPLIKILGKTLIEHVYSRAIRAELLNDVIIATDHSLIKKEVEKFSGKVYLTSLHHKTGTERVAEVAEKIDSDIVLNIQGDEPLIEPDLLNKLVLALQDEKILIATIVEKEKNLNLINDPNTVKVVVDNNDNAIYFSRSPIPYKPKKFFYRHVGIYGFQKKFLFDFVNIKPSYLEETEKLEQLRALENGIKIKVIYSPYNSWSVDTEEDLKKVINYFKSKKNG